jgi:hypothetical protein
MIASAALSYQERAYELARQEFENIVEHLDSEEACAMTHSKLEREIEKKGRELMRKLLLEHLENSGPGKCDQSVCGADGVEAVLRLRALRSSRYFDEFWTFHEAREYERNHQALYAGGIVPPTNSSATTAKRTHLKVIK